MGASAEGCGIASLGASVNPTGHPQQDDMFDEAVATLGARGVGAAVGPLVLPASYAVRGGPRATVYFDAPRVRAAIVTVGGLCPGLNDVVLALTQARR